MPAKTSPKTPYLNQLGAVVITRPQLLSHNLNEEDPGVDSRDEHGDDEHGDDERGRKPEEAATVACGQRDPGPRPGWPSASTP